MQRDYVILNHLDRTPVMVSIHSYDYPSLLQSGYTVVFQGSKRQCNEIFEMEGSLCD